MRLHLAWLLVALPAWAAELTPERVAQIRRDEAAAHARIAVRFGNRKHQELTAEERSAIVREQQAASREVLGRHGVSVKELARYTGKLKPEELRAVEDAERALEEKERAAKSAAPPPPTEPEVVRDVGEEGERVEPEQAPADSIPVEPP
jgi:hypothetical protein